MNYYLLNPESSAYFWYRCGTKMKTNSVVPSAESLKVFSFDWPVRLCPNRLQFWGFLVAEMANIWVETVIAQTLPDLLNTDIRKYGANQILRNSELSTVYIEGSPVEIRTPEPWNPIGRSLTLLPPSSILPPLSPHYAFIPARKKFGACSKNITFFKMP